MFHELIGRAKRQYPLDRFTRRDFHLVVDRLINVAALRQFTEPFRHIDERLVRLKKMARFRVDQSDTARHVRQDFFVEDDFALDSSRGFGLAPRNSSCEPGGERGHHDEPECWNRDFVQ